MANRLGQLSKLAASTGGAFALSDATDQGITRKQIAGWCRDGVIDRLLPRTYRMTSVPKSNAQWLHAALLWRGSDAAADGRSAAEVYRAEGVRATQPELAVWGGRARSPLVVTHQVAERAALMVRHHRGFPVVGPEATALSLASCLESEAFEIACEDLRRRQLITVPSLRAYLDRFGLNRPGAAPMRRLLDELDPMYPSRSTLEVKTRRLLVAHGISDFVREFPLTWNGRTYYFDFTFHRGRTMLETNGRRWHDDPLDYEDDNEKWSVPARYGFKIVFATWKKVTEEPHALIDELRSTLDQQSTRVSLPAS